MMRITINDIMLYVSCCDPTPFLPKDWNISLVDFLELGLPVWDRIWLGSCCGLPDKEYDKYVAWYEARKAPKTNSEWANEGKLQLDYLRDIAKRLEAKE